MSYLIIKIILIILLEHNFDIYCLHLSTLLELPKHALASQRPKAFDSSAKIGGREGRRVCIVAWIGTSASKEFRFESTFKSITAGAVDAFSFATEPSELWLLCFCPNLTIAAAVPMLRFRMC
jgi:hypothetical protein